jgi:hypothetical protein
MINITQELLADLLFIGIIFLLIAKVPTLENLHGVVAYHDTYQ